MTELHSTKKKDHALISIIIPTFNRGHLIDETLDSVAAQTYQNWECLVVDDGSTDDTAEAALQWAKRDSRFQFHQRPPELSKGANTCRNFGYNLSKGEYIQWYDSDDLMLPNNLELKIEELVNGHWDFVVSKSSAFVEGEIPRTIRAFGKYSPDLSLSVFAKQEFSWMTDDGMYSRDSVYNVAWNEDLKSGQDFNFICRYLATSPKGIFINEVLSIKRQHPTSIQGNLSSDPIQYHQNRFYAFLQTFEDLSSDDIKIRPFLTRSLSHYYKLKPEERPLSFSRLVGRLRKYLTISQIALVWLTVFRGIVATKVKSLNTRLRARVFNLHRSSTWIQVTKR